MSRSDGGVTRDACSSSEAVVSSSVFETAALAGGAALWSGIAGVTGYAVAVAALNTRDCQPAKAATHKDQARRPC
jgi:hypothetical protein